MFGPYVVGYQCYSTWEWVWEWWWWWWGERERKGGGSIDGQWHSLMLGHAQLWPAPARDTVQRVTVISGSAISDTIPVPAEPVTWTPQFSPYLCYSLAALNLKVLLPESVSAHLLFFWLLTHSTSRLLLHLFPTLKSCSMLSSIPGCRIVLSTCDSSQSTYCLRCCSPLKSCCISLTVVVTLSWKVL